MNDPILPLPGLSPAGGKAVVVKFDGGLLSSDGGVLALRGHCQSKFYTACARTRAGGSSTVFAHKLPTRRAGFDAENGLYLFALTVPFQSSGSTDGTGPYAEGLASLRSESELAAPNVTRTGVGGIFDSILALTFAAIIGHESSHLETTPPFCAIEQRSRLEEVGTWDVLFRVETSGELFEAGLN